MRSSHTINRQTFKFIGYNGSYYLNGGYYDVEDADGHPKVMGKDGFSRLLDTNFFNNNFVPLTLEEMNDYLLKGMAVIDFEIVDNKKIISNVGRTFESGASRNSEEGKLDFEGFLSPSVLLSYAEYMDSMRYLEDGTLRDSDNWQKGIPKDVYMKSMWRHFFDVWQDKRRCNTSTDDRVLHLNALLFNVMGLLHEELKGS